MSDSFYILWNFLTFQKERLVWAGLRQGNSINRWGRGFTRAGLAVNEVKGEPLHLNTRPQEMDMLAVPQQGLNHVIPKAHTADAQIYVCWFPVWWDIVLLFSGSVMFDYLSDCSTLGFPVFYHLLEFAQTHAHWVDDVIQPSHPLSPHSPPALNIS